MRAVLKAIIVQHGLFVPRAKDIYSFSHLSFQEYFTAKYVVDHLSSADQEAFIQQYLEEDKWREVFLMCTEMHSRADHFLLTIKTYIDQFAREQELNKWLYRIDHIVKKSSIIQGEWGRAWCVFLILDFARARAPVFDDARASARASARAPCPCPCL